MSATPLSDASHPWLRWSWQPRDHHPLISHLGTLTALAATALGLFGLPPLDIHGPLHYVGVMDPLCGGTRAVAYTIHGEWASAWRYNPLGILVVAAAAGTVLRVLIAALTRRWLTATLCWTPNRSRVLRVGLTVLFVILTVRQQFLAEVLMANT